MKTLLAALALLSLLAPTAVQATTQIVDKIYLEGQNHPLFTLPLEKYYGPGNPRPKFRAVFAVDHLPPGDLRPVYRSRVDEKAFKLPDIHARLNTGFEAVPPGGLTQYEINRLITPEMYRGMALFTNKEVVRVMALAIRNALIMPAKSISSTNTNISIPTTALGSSAGGRGSVRTWSGGDVLRATALVSTPPMGRAQDQTAG